MASHYLSIDRGVPGLKRSDWTTGTSSNATAVFELRVLDGASVTHLDVDKVLEAMQHWFQDIPAVAASGFDVTT